LTKLVKGVLALEPFAFTPALVADMAESISKVDNPRYMGPLGPHMADVSLKVLNFEMDSLDNPKTKARVTAYDMQRMLQSLQTLGHINEDIVSAATKLLPRINLTSADCQSLQDSAKLMKELGFEADAQEWEKASSDNNLLTRIGSI